MSRLIKCSICGAELGFDEKLIPHNVNSCLVTLQARIAELESERMPDDVLETVIESVSTWNTQYPERYLLARSHLIAVRDARSKADAKGAK